VSHDGIAILDDELFSESLFSQFFYVFLMPFSCFFRATVLRKRPKVLLHIHHGGFNLVPGGADRSGDLLGGTGLVNFEGTRRLEFSQRVMESGKEIENRLSIIQQSIHAASRVSALDQIYQEEDEKDQSGRKERVCLWVRQDVHVYPCERSLEISQDGGNHCANCRAQKLRHCFKPLS
jgi:hypothetical protein